MVIYEEKGIVTPEKGVELETKSYYLDRDSPGIIVATGLGGSAGKHDLVEALAKDFNVLTFSPRNSGKSNGKFGVQSYYSDLAYVAREQAQLKGKRSFGIGHSFGGYCLAKLLEEDGVVKKAVLLAPLTHLGEQNPYLIDKLFSAGSKSESLARLIGLGCAFSNGFRYPVVNDQRFNYADIREFLQELHDSNKIDKKLKSPTQVHLAGRTTFRLGIDNLDELKKYWENLGAEVKTYPEVNHWFSGKGFSGVGKEFSLCQEEGITSNIINFFRN